MTRSPRYALTFVPWVAFAAACKESGPRPADTPAADTTAAPAAPPPAPPVSSTPPPSAPAPPAASASAVAAPPSETTAPSWSFDSDKADGAPSGFSFGRTGQGRAGKWVVKAADDAPSRPNVLVQLDADTTDYRFPIAVADASSFTDLALSVSCKPTSGHVDQGCGLIWRYKDENNYYVTRANALEDNVRLYYVKDGKRIQISSWSGKVASRQWHKLSVTAKGNRFDVSFDGKKVLEATDSTFPGPGKVGVWTKADSVIEFDDLSASAL